jgi:radical SAM superfamily enzyme YgiQ (UPF0313 family)
MTCLTHSRHNAYFWAERVKELLPGVRVLLGGVHASAEPEETLRHIPSVDFVAIGEGEETAYALCRVLAEGGTLGSIAGLAHREDGNVRINTARPFLTDLNELPFIDRDLFLPSVAFGKVETLALMAGRGCPGHCKFCTSATLWHGRRRLRSLEHIRGEIEECRRKFPNVRFLKFRDEALLSKREWSLELLDYLRTLGLPWECWCKLSFLDEPMIAAMKQAHCYRVRIGIESGSARLQREMHKGVNLARAPEIYALMRRYGVRYSSSFILGLPGATADDVKATVDFARAIRTDPLSSTISFVTYLYPGTPYFEEYRRENPDFLWERVPRRFYAMPHAEDSRGNYLYPCAEMPDGVPADPWLMGAFLRNFPRNTWHFYGKQRFCRLVRSNLSAVLRGMGLRRPR